MAPKWSVEGVGLKTSYKQVSHSHHRIGLHRLYLVGPAFKLSYHICPFFWISACNGAAGYDGTFSSGCRAVVSASRHTQPILLFTEADKN